MGNMPQLMQMQSMQQQNQLNQMTMQEKQRGQQEMNALRGLMSSPDFDLSTPASQRKVYEVAPTQAESILKGYYGNLKTGAEVRNLGFTGQETQAKLALEKQKHLGQMYRDISSRPSDANITAHAEDVEASPMYTPEEKTAVRTKAERLLAMPMADRMAMLSQQGATAGELRPQVVAPGASLMSGSTVVGTAPKEAPTYAPSPDQQGYDVSKAQGYKGTFLEYKKELANAARAPAQPRAEPALRTQQVTMNDGTLGIMNMDTGAVTPATLGGAAVKGKPTAFAEKQAAAKVQLQKDLTFAITEIGDAIKEGGLIDQSTGSGAGRLADISMGFVGKATPGAIAIGKLQPIADLPLKLVPRFEGPQSNADLKTYQQASAQLADPTLPRAIRKAAGATIVRLMTERQGQFATKDMAPTVENAAKADPKAEAAAFLKSMGVTQ
jgi:hypothetical protein